MFETITRTNLKDALSLEIDTRGEYVIIVEGSKETYDDSLSIKDHVTQLIDEGYNEKDAMKMVAKKRQITKSEVYKAYKING
jgi:16S rRNA (cytidine1402-2'-O)-methyltransferase